MLEMQSLTFGLSWLCFTQSPGQMTVIRLPLGESTIMKMKVEKERERTEKVAE